MNIGLQLESKMKTPGFGCVTLTLYKMTFKDDLLHKPGYEMKSSEDSAHSTGVKTASLLRVSHASVTTPSSD